MKARKRERSSDGGDRGSDAKASTRTEGAKGSSRGSSSKGASGKGQEGSSKGGEGDKSGGKGDDRGGRNAKGGGNRSSRGGSGRKRRRRGRGRSGGGGGGGGGGGSQNRKPKRSDVGFWGEPERLPEAGTVRLAEDPAAVPRSLGHPNLPGHEAIAQHYFRVVYERAVQTAGALAAAGGLIDPQAMIAHDEHDED